MQTKKSGFTASVSFALLAALLSAFVPPASAGGPKKTISLSVTPTTPSTGTVSATITNTGNSNANSFEIDWTTTSPDFHVSSAVAGGTEGTCSATGCVFLKQLPTKSSITVELMVEVTNQCNPMSITWSASAWTGSPGSVSTSFVLESPFVTSSSPNCSVEFVTQPKDAFIGSTVTGAPFNSSGTPVTVQLLQAGVAATGTAVSLSASPGSCATGPASAMTDASGVAELEFTAAAASASCVLTATAPGYGSANSESFKVVEHGELGCNTDNNTFGNTGAGGLAVNGTRLGNVDDPSPTAVGGSTAPACVVVPYVVSTTCPAGVTGACTDFIYDPLDQGTHMAFLFHWDWPARPLSSLPAPGGIQTIEDTQQFFINGNQVTGVNLDFCPEISPTLTYDESGNVIGVELAAGQAPADQEFPSPPGTQAGCLLRRDVNLMGDQYQVSEDAYVQGDYAARRN